MKKMHALLTDNATIEKSVHLINEVSCADGVAGIAVVINENKRVTGVVTDGDIRDAYCKRVDFSQPVKSIMSNNFIFAYEDLSPYEQLRSVLVHMNTLDKADDPRFTKVIVCNRSMEFVDIINLFELYKYGDISSHAVSVYGLGFVGLTLALTLAESKIDVTGIEIDEKLLKNLAGGRVHFYENGVESLLRQCVSTEAITFKHISEPVKTDIHIISVGTPVSRDNKPVYTSLESAGKKIGALLKEGDLVICRSTVPVGTTRNFLIPLLEKSSGLQAGKEFYVAFAPERTVEGNALTELKTLPQIVGGYSNDCAEMAAKLFKKITPSIIQVESLEAAEIVKLINNSFRDLVFSFANEASMICDKYNIDAFDIIQAANDGYPRNAIPTPSPGVGGACLTKDPFLYLHNNNSEFHTPRLGEVSRSINRKVPCYIFNKLKKLRKFSEGHAFVPTMTKVFIVGLAFKGLPETSDTRFSPAIDLIHLLAREGYEIMGFDMLVPEDEIKKIGITPVSLEEGMVRSQAAFFMNNHPENRKFDVYNTLIKCKKPFLFFDGWRMFSKREIEKIPGVTYGTLGYSSVGREFYITEVRDYEYTKTKTPATLSVTLPEEGEMVEVNPAVRRLWEYDQPKKSLLWAAGGGSYLLNNRYILLVKRSSDSPSNPDKLTISTGFSDSFDEMRNPSLLIRELFEELVILDYQGRLILPQFSGPDKKRVEQINFLSKTAIITGAKRAGVKWKNERCVGACVDDTLLLDEVRVRCNGQEVFSKALIHCDQRSGKVNFLYAVPLEETLHMDQLTFFDTETKMHSDGTLFPLKRKIFFYDVLEERLFQGEGRGEVNHKEERFTPQAEYFITALKKHMRK